MSMTINRTLLIGALCAVTLTGCAQGGAPSAHPSPTPGSYVRGGITYVRGEVSGMPAGPGIDMRRSPRLTGFVQTD